jgi:hypothetical protein
MQDSMTTWAAVGIWSLLLLVGAAVGLFLLLRRCRIDGRILLFSVPLFVIVLAFFLLPILALVMHGGLSMLWIVLFFLVGSLTSWPLISGLIQLFRPTTLGNRPPTCPPVGLLKDFLAERLPPQEHARLAAHLDDCTACQQWVEGLTAGQESWAGMARKLTEQPPPAAPALQGVIERLKGAKKQEATADEPVFAGDLPLGFLSPPDKPGQLGRLERYDVLEEVGRGGMGIVLKAFDPSLHRVVAIKVLAPQLATSGVARKRFLREAKAAAAVTHDHIVTIHAVDEAGGLPYLVMQYVAGLSLQERIDKEGPLAELAEILRIGVQTASGLAAAHGHGIVHRDIKPANILLEEGVGRVKITDFGLARALDDASLTQSGVVAGSPLYMAPEQARGEAPDHRADLFSLGSVLYTICTGRPPFRAANTLAVLRRVCEDAPRPIRETNPEVPDWLAAVVEKLMAKDPADRFQSAGEVVEVLGRHLGQLQHPAWVPPAPASADAAGLPTSVTICPSCGASLHVPERMVGSVVHCGECGEPFPVEEGSEEILVARAVPSPFGRRARAKTMLPAWACVVGGCAALLFILVPLALLSLPAPGTVAGIGSLPPQEAVATPEAAPFWKSTLGWFPAEATLFGAVDLKAFGSLNLGDEWTRALLRLALPAETGKNVTPENLGRIRIDSVSMAYYEDPKPGQSRALVQLEGLALDGRKRVVDFIREAGAGKGRAGEDDRGWQAGKPARVSSPELPFAIGLYDDHRVFLARAMGRDNTESQHLKALEHLSWFDLSNRPRPSGDLLSGYNPPWLQLALQEIPSGACGLCLGEIPAAWRKLLTEGLELRACPRTFVCSLRREDDGVALSLSLNLDKAGAELILLEDLEKWRRRVPDDLQARFPALREEPEALALLGQTLKTMPWGANPGSRCVGTGVRITGPTGRALAALLNRTSQPREEGEKER